MDSQRLFSREKDFQKTFSLTENQFSGKTYFYTIASRMSGYLVQLGGKGSGGGRDFVQDVVNLLKFLGFVEESEKLRRQRLK